VNDDQNDQPGTTENHDAGNLRPRGGNGQWIRTMTDAERDARAVQLRVQGMTLAQVAAELGYQHAGSAHRAIQRALASVPVATVSEYRAMQNQQLDMLTAEVFAMMRRPAPLVTPGGKIVTDSVTGEVIEDRAARAKCVELLLKIAERRAKLLGLDAPNRQLFTLERLADYVQQLDREIEERKGSIEDYEDWCAIDERRAELESGDDD